MEFRRRSQNLSKAYAMEVLSVDGFPNGISLTTHVIEEAQNKLGFKSFLDADLFIQQTVRKAAYLGNIMERSGKHNRVFAYDSIVFILDIHTDEIITVYPRQYTDTYIETIYNRATDKTKALVEQLRYFHSEEIRWYKRINRLLHEGKEAQAFEQERYLYKFRMRKRSAVRSIAYYLKTEDALSLVSQSREVLSL